jgi:chaperonin GroES
MTKIVPFSDNVVIEAVEEEITSNSGIIIPETASKEKPVKGKVLAVGPGRLDKDGKRIEMEIKEGDMVLYSKYGPNEIKIEGKDLLICSADSVYAKLA